MAVPAWWLCFASRLVKRSESLPLLSPLIQARPLLPEQWVNCSKGIFECPNKLYNCPPLFSKCAEMEAWGIASLRWCAQETNESSSHLRRSTWDVMGAQSWVASIRGRWHVGAHTHAQPTSHFWWHHRMRGRLHKYWILWERTNIYAVQTRSYTKPTFSVKLHKTGFFSKRSSVYFLGYINF